MNTIEYYFHRETAIHILLEEDAYCVRARPVPGRRKSPKSQMVGLFVFWFVRNFGHWLNPQNNFGGRSTNWISLKFEQIDEQIVAKRKERSQRIDCRWMVWTLTSSWSADNFTTTSLARRKKFRRHVDSLVDQQMTKKRRKEKAEWEEHTSMFLHVTTFLSLFLLAQAQSDPQTETESGGESPQRLLDPNQDPDFRPRSAWQLKSSFWPSGHHNSGLDLDLALRGQDLRGRAAFKRSGNIPFSSILNPPRAHHEECCWPSAVRIWISMHEIDTHATQWCYSIYTLGTRESRFSRIPRNFVCSFLFSGPENFESLDPGIREHLLFSDSQVEKVNKKLFLQFFVK